jgi:polysaccharide deacetylase family protein (PEP-CTERM system associated)
MSAAPRIALTVDLEDSHHGLGVSRRASSFASDVDWTLELFARFRVRATFFVLADVVDDYPAVVRRIAAAGHEIGSHGPAHEFLYRMTPAAFARGLQAATLKLQELSGARVRGFRAPFFSVTPETAWSLPILAEQGIEYDASIYPGPNDRYGWPGAPLEPCCHQQTGLKVFPVPLLSPRVPLAFSGGAYLRLLPYQLISWGLQRQALRAQPGMIYFHPWEVAQDLPWRTDARLRANLTRHALRPRMRSQLMKLMASSAPVMGTMGDVINGLHHLPVWDPMVELKSAAPFPDLFVNEVADGVAERLNQRDGASHHHIARHQIDDGERDRDVHGREGDGL